MVAAEVREVLDRYADLLRGRFGDRLERVVLFGSHARGTARADSDVDVLVVIDGLQPGERATAVDLAYRASSEAGPASPIPSPLVWSRDEHLDRLSRERRIALDIERDGVRL